MDSNQIMEPLYPSSAAIEYANEDLVRKGRNPDDFRVTAELKEMCWHVTYQDKQATRGGTIMYTLDHESGKIVDVSYLR